MLPREDDIPRLCNKLKVSVNRLWNIFRLAIPSCGEFYKRTNNVSINFKLVVLCRRQKVCCCCTDFHHTNDQLTTTTTHHLLHVSCSRTHEVNGKV